ncbi:hypothetical protein QLQ12_14570 [Actinoplanes sp. NEAU-A12]|uniref:DUF4760 domain-containing protein n=1 Tax=Actinoplanes sandaracinus TaxID=3045177 RepID=A0ABT6WJC0_9ACTN|nr:hypothetical protein [Actinoplanes sandaracinus]MDI6099823.1 hypothetical protein [Actinoplanes sandaracinus]
MEIIAGIVGAILGALGTMIVARLESRRTGRLKAVYDLYARWHSSEMNYARIRAHHVFHSEQQNRVPKSYWQINESLWAGGREDDWIAIQLVIHYFESCGELLEEGAIDRSLFQRMMGRYASYWIDRYIHPLWFRSLEPDDGAELGWYTKIACLRENLGPGVPLKA